MLGGDGAASSRERRARLRAGLADAADRSRLMRRAVAAAGGAAGGTLLSSLETKRLEGEREKRIIKRLMIKKLAFSWPYDFFKAKKSLLKVFKKTLNMSCHSGLSCSGSRFRGVSFRITAYQIFFFVVAVP